MRSLSAGSLQRQDHPPPTQPRRRPRCQPSPTRHPGGTATPPPTHPRLHGTAHCRREIQERSDALPQALHRPRSLPRATTTTNKRQNPWQHRASGIKRSNDYQNRCRTSEHLVPSIRINLRAIHRNGPRLACLWSCIHGVGGTGSPSRAPVNRNPHPLARHVCVVTLLVPDRRDFDHVPEAAHLCSLQHRRRPR